MTYTREDWKAAREAMDAIEAKREKLLEPTKLEFVVAMEGLAAIEEEIGTYIDVEGGELLWRYEILHGPDGEANYAWVYDGQNNMVCPAKTYHAMAIVSGMNAGFHEWAKLCPDCAAAKAGDRASPPEGRQDGGVDAQLEFQRIRDALANGLTDEAFETADRAMNALSRQDGGVAVKAALHCVVHALMVLPVPIDGQGKRAWASLHEAQTILEAALAHRTHVEEETLTAVGVKALEWRSRQDYHSR